MVCVCSFVRRVSGSVGVYDPWFEARTQTYTPHTDVIHTHIYIYTYCGQQLVDVPHHVVDTLEPVGDIGARRRLVAGEEGACFVLEF